jgi:hypothetical protein
MQIYMTAIKLSVSYFKFHRDPQRGVMRILRALRVLRVLMFLMFLMFLRLITCILET